MNTTSKPSPPGVSLRAGGIAGMSSSSVREHTCKVMRNVDYSSVDITDSVILVSCRSNSMGGTQAFILSPICLRMFCHSAHPPAGLMQSADDSNRVAVKLFSPPLDIPKGDSSSQ